MDSQENQDEFTKLLNSVLNSIDNSTDNSIRSYLRQMLREIIQLAEDGVDETDLKIIVKSIQEFRHAFKVFRKYDHRKKISVFGSSRSESTNPNYEAAEKFSRLAAAAGYMLNSGAGPGIMEAVNKGAGSENSFGLHISIPFEYQPNQYIKSDSKCLHFRFFFSRKLVFAKESEALVYFPGGFGTHDELFELLCLMQTGRHDLAPLILCDTNDYWESFTDYLKTNLLEEGTISENDLQLIDYVDSPEEALELIENFYSNYHSSRFLNEDYIIRFRDFPSEEDFREFESEFHHLCPESGFTINKGPLKGEEESAPENYYRLKFYFSNQDYGELRRLIDFINQW